MKVIKTVLKVLVALILIVILLIVGIVLFVNPNQFKPMIIQKVKKATGRDLTIDGALSWSFIPWLDIETGHLILSNPSNFSEKNFLEIKKAKINLEFFPLLMGQMRVGRIELSKPVINLQKNNMGEINWQLDKKTQPTQLTSAKTHTQNAFSGTTQLIGWTIAKLDMDDATIRYEDSKLQKSFYLQHFNFSAHDVNVSKFFPAKLSFDMVIPTLAVQNHFDFNTQLQLDVLNKQYTFKKMNLTLTTQQTNHTWTSQLTGEIHIDLNKQTLSVTPLKGQVVQANWEGVMHVTALLTNPTLEGQIKIQPFDLISVLKEIGVSIPNVQIAKGIQAEINFSADKKSNQAAGVFRIEQLQAAKLHLSNIKAPFHWQRNVLNIMPVTANLYGGKATLETQFRFDQKIPQMNSQLTLSTVQVQPLMNDYLGAHSITFVGQGNLFILLTTNGNTQNSLLQNLNGKINLSVNNGYIDGIDLANLFDHAAAFVKGQSQPLASSKNQTPFGRLTDTAIIQNGILNTQDLLLDSPRFTVNGTGTINLIAQKINFGLQMLAKKMDVNQKDDLSNLYGLPVPVSVVGSFNHPVFRLDIQRLAEAIAKKQFEKAANHEIDKLKDQSHVTVPDNARKLLNNLLGK